MFEKEGGDLTRGEGASRSMVIIQDYSAVGKGGV
jgi:hypothetical protein